MASELEVTTTIWQRWSELREKPMDWKSLRAFVEQCFKQGQTDTEEIYKMASEGKRGFLLVKPKVKVEEDFITIGDKTFTVGPQIEAGPPREQGEIIKQTRDWEIVKHGDRFLYTHYEFGQHWLMPMTVYMCKEGLGEPFLCAQADASGKCTDLKMEAEGCFKIDAPRESGKWQRTPLSLMKAHGLPWPNPSPDATVEVNELPTFAPAMLGLIREAWEKKESKRFWDWLVEPIEDGVLVGLVGVSRPHELFPKAVIEDPKFRKAEFAIKHGVEIPISKGFWNIESGATFFFETTEERDRARELLGHSNFYFPDGPKISLAGIGSADYMLELLASEGFDTSRITVER